MKVYSEMTFQAWQTLLDLTSEGLDLASSYWTLRGEDVYCVSTSLRLARRVDFQRTCQR